MYNDKAQQWLAQMKETQERFFVFLGKLEERMEELTEASVPELKEIREADERDFYNMKSGILGQLRSIRDKADATFDQKVSALDDEIYSSIDLHDPIYKDLLKFRTACSDRLHQDFEDKFHHCQDLIEATEDTDYEVVYQQILDEFEANKNKFKCQQCGDVIPLEKIYFIRTYLTCPSCQTQNTYVPSTLTSGLEQIGRSLAEQRTKGLLGDYGRAQRKERELYQEKHQLSLKSHFNESQEDKQRLEDMEKEYQELKKDIPLLYQKYQRAMFDEWKCLVPDLAEQTENFYQGLLKRNY